MSDNNYPPGNFCDQDSLLIDGLVLTPPDQGAGFDDLLKLSHVTNSTFKNVRVLGGKQRENALDVNNNSCGNSFENLDLYAGQECAILCKGGSSNNTWRETTILRSGGHCDVYIGDYSDQSHEWCKNNRFIDLARSDGDPVRVRWAWGDRPIVTGNSNVKFQYCLSAVSFLYVLFKTLLHPKLIS